jgi:hypothetical protein
MHKRTLMSLLKIRHMPRTCYKCAVAMFVHLSTSVVAPTPTLVERRSTKLRRLTTTTGNGHLLTCTCGRQCYNITEATILSSTNNVEASSSLPIRMPSHTFQDCQDKTLTFAFSKSVRFHFTPQLHISRQYMALANTRR